MRAPVDAVLQSVLAVHLAAEHGGELLIRLCGILPIQEGVDTHTSDELRLILAESAAGGELSRRERLMMENVLDLEDKAVRQVMVPRRDVVYLNTRRTIEENLELITESRHTVFRCVMANSTESSAWCTPKTC